MAQPRGAATLPERSDDLAKTRQVAAYRALRQALIAGRFEPGRPLSVRQISEVLGLGTMPARQAVQRLIAEGALEHEPNQPLRVPQVNMTRLIEIAEISTQLERLAIPKSAAQADANDLAQMRAALIKMRSASVADDADAALQANVSFWFAIYGASRSQLLIELLEGMWLRLGPVLISPYRANYHDKGRPASKLGMGNREQFRVFQDLIDAIATHDQRRAVRINLLLNREMMKWWQRNLATSTSFLEL